MTEVKVNPSQKKERWPLTNWQIFWITVIGVMILLTPLWIYMGYFLRNGISGEPEHWGQFGDFIGGVLNPLIGFLTLAATIVIAVMLKRIDDRNRKADRAVNFKPDLFLDQPGFYTYKQQQYGGEKPVEYSLTSKGFMYRSPLQVPNKFGMKVFNIGLGAAKNIQLTFEINTTEIAVLINQRQIAMPVDARINVIHQAMPVAGLVRFEYPAAWHTGPFQLIERLEDTKRVSALLPESTAFYLLDFPQYFLEMHSVYQYVWNWWLQNDANQRPAFPPIYLNMKYQDIANTKFKKKFKIQLRTLTGGSPEFTSIILVTEEESVIENEN